MAAAATDQPKKPGWRRVLRALGNRKTGFMALFGFASGLPYALLLGTLYAWLSDAKVDLETMGVFSLIGLAYSFKFLWSPLLDRVELPLLKRLGKRKQWIVSAQLMLGLILLVLSTLNPLTALGWFSLLAGIGAFASATQDVVVDAWRVDVADEEATIDMLSTVYQMGYRIAALVGGALALFLAERTDWPTVYATMGAIIALVGVLGLFAPDAEVTAATIGAAEDELLALREAGEIDPRVRKWTLFGIGLLWAWALITVGLFMVRSLGSDPETRPDSVAFIATKGPLVVIATVVVPALVAAWLVRMKDKGRYVLTAATPARSAMDRFVDHGYRALILPLTDFVGRLGWAVILVFALVLTYRITDAIWGSFAYPFYLGELKYSKDEVAIASKFFGVGALVVGLALGGTLLTVMGRMATLTFGALIAALTNLLYADLALGGARIAAVSDASGFTWLVSHLGGDQRLAKLMLAIAGENIAVGIAGAAFVAYLSSVVAKGYSAVQYALLSSLTLLVGTLGRGALGQMIEEYGYYPVFLLTTAMGMVAVVLCLIEWARVARLGRASGIDATALEGA
ncbi:MFS transporter [Novosphingobium sp. PY1]|uniref:AmpG family muropeptide MFS transporter n=1 Tax=Novosphingobium sp. PY1 TaxID=1882221 RepID=UPI000BE775F3|nr:MFS transporter [Novosphingobium sp. PY1]BBA73920.1 beta-lactamase induction signal transducer [Novosphingobium sp. PY1]GFM31157.1 beta-lactamase induction signal transducer [Novosphingobium sp. PY1]